MKIQLSVPLYLLLVLFAKSTFAQNSATDSTTSHLQIEKGIALYDDGKYTEALAVYKSIPKSDANYWWACYETALLYYNQDSLTWALAKCRESQDLNPENVGTYSLTGSILDDMGKTPEAIEYLNNALVTWPYNRSLLYNLAACYFRANELEKAEATAIRNIRINPYHKSSHLLLAKVNFFMGRLAQSYMAYNMAILMNPQVNTITEFEKAVSGKMDSLSFPYKYPYPAGVAHSNWDECTWFLKSEMAFSNNFEYDYKVNYLTTRQSLMLFHKLKFSQSDTSVYSQFYARFFTEMMEKNYFEPFLFYSFKNTGNDVVKEWFAKNQAKNDEFVNWAQKQIDGWKCYGFSTTNEAQNVKTYHFDDDGNLSSIGTIKTVPDESKSGPWLTINDDGGIQEKGAYADNKLEGDWKIFWSNGKMKQQLVFDNNKLNGKIYTYYKNGSKSGIYFFVDGEKQGLQQEFTSSGQVLSIENYQDKMLNGKKIFYNYSEGYARESDYAADKLEGKIIEKWLNGALKSEYNFKDSLLEGPFRTWYSNSKPESEGNYRANVEVGKWTDFYPDGSKKAEGEDDENGKLTGKRTEYFRNGIISSIDSLYVNGLLNGTMVKYYENGAIKSKLFHKDDKPQSLEIFDINGKSLYSATAENGVLKFRSYYPDGILEMDGVLKDGDRDGKWTIYFPFGTVAQELNYSNGFQTGLQKKYHENGQLKEEYSCDSNDIIGPYREYFSSGKLKLSGAFNKDGKKGEWISYFSNDTVEQRYSYEKDVQSGREFSYSPTGKIDMEEYFNDEGLSKRLKSYDLAGNIASDQKYEYDSVLLTQNYPSGKLKFKRLSINGKPHGDCESYYPNGKLLSVYPYIYGHQNGTYKRWDLSGRPELEMPYTMGELNGLVKIYDDGKNVSADPYENGNEQGTRFTYFSNGKVASKTMFVNDQKHGNSDCFAPDTSFMYRLVYYENCLRAYTYKNAKDEFVSEKPVTTATTEVLCYYANGKVSARFKMKNGQFDGQSIAYYPNGKIMREIMYSKGDFEGPYKSYYETGKLKELINYHNDERDGMSERYFENGQKHETSHYVAGQIEGEWLLYNEDGKVVNTIIYNNNDVYDVK